ncbi:MAG: zinc ribbon domain-containing protein [Candidatus Omnitrophota bacterium]|jgi:putative FmdB family regulatory protein
MFYDFKCRTHGVFTVSQPIASEHKADCPRCNKPAARVFSNLQWIWAGSAYRPDGSLRQDKDYAPVMKG